MRTSGLFPSNLDPFVFAVGLRGESRLNKKGHCITSTVRSDEIFSMVKRLFPLTFRILNLSSLRRCKMGKMDTMGEKNNSYHAISGAYRTRTMPLFRL